MSAAEQLDLTFEPDAATKQRLADKWLGNVCPSCRAQPGEPCKAPTGGFGRDDHGHETWIHGTRSRFERPGQCLGLRCEDPADCWGCEP